MAPFRLLAVQTEGLARDHDTGANLGMRGEADFVEIHLLQRGNLQTKPESGGLKAEG